MAFLGAFSAAAADKGKGPAVGFEAFWTSYRDAVLSGNLDSVASLTRFPFITRGETDGDPEVKHDRAAFVRQLPGWMEQDTGLSEKPESMLDYIRRMKTPPPGAVQGGSARVGQFVFERVAGRWTFVKAYVGD